MVDDRVPDAVFIGFDLAATRDLNAVCTLKRYGELDYRAEFKFFLPEAGLELIPKHYADIFRVAVGSGILKITEGNVMDDREVSDYINSECAKYEVKEVGYDAYNASSLVARQNPLRIYITTASFTKDTKFYEDFSMYQSMLYVRPPTIQDGLGCCIHWIKTMIGVIQQSGPRPIQCMEYRFLRRPLPRGPRRPSTNQLHLMSFCARL